MAKQRGIHQISGKINNLCYYEQKYIRGGLIRRINEAMSERLKTDPAFENTRYANRVFGGCSMIAGIILDFFNSRNTYMFKPNRQALLTREVKKYLAQVEGIDKYPTIFSKILGEYYLPIVVNNIVKNSIFNSFNELERSYKGLVLNDSKDFTFSRDSLVSYCKKYKSMGVLMSISRAHYIYPTQYNPDINAYFTPDSNPGGRGSFVHWYLDGDIDDVVLSTNTGDRDDATTFWIVYAIPILSVYRARPVFGETGASCGIITFSAE